MSENKMNRICFVICLLVMFICIIGGCTPAFYEGDNPEYYEIINANTLFITHECYFSHSTELERDEYGRILFILRIKNQYDIYGICQYSKDESYGYYEDYCYYVFETDHKLKDYELDGLKQKNDWSKPLDWNKITLNDKEYDQKLIATFNAFCDFNDFNEENVSNWLPKCRNKNGYWIYIASVKDGKTNDCFFVLFNEKQDEVLDECIVNDTVNCQDELHEFKEKNNWFGGNN